MPVRVKLDEDLPAEIGDLLRNAGHDARTVVEPGLTGTPDDGLWSVVQQERACLFTADKGFANAQVFPPGPELPPEIVANTAARYREALRRLTRF